ncbi:hypothetical protein SITYG_14220 [Streptococcus intermedius]|uniref:Uncharacterized protein n=1 Tax=Streptococcus intermedius TaxID=1338 RepID=A0AAD1FKA6_STRIT|nr:hypothetical protein [Streptococcus intermedius]BAW17401.1 hypothetical protein SITYG_14220 [Streptococcus intermedius]
MELNNMDILSDEFCDILERVYANRIGTISIYDIVDEPNHHTFKLKFRVYNFAGVKFQYENDLFEIHLFLNINKEKVISKPNSHYSEISDWDSYLKEIMLEIESYIPEKYLKAKGWR